MNRAERLKEVLTEGCAIRLVKDDIYSALSDDSNRHFYDRRATAYDSVVGTRLYNRIMWGTSPLDYIAFASEAIMSNPGERMLDAVRCCLQRNSTSLPIGKSLPSINRCGCCSARVLD
jgi:hypothetical protein